MMIGKRYILAFILCVLSVAVFSSVPVERIRFRATLVDGRQLMLTSYGDEHLSFFLTDEGRVAELTDSGFCLTDYNREEYLALRLPQAEQRRSVRRIGTRESALLGQIGTKHVAVLLVQFQDSGFTVAPDSASVNEYYQRYCNGKPGVSPYTAHGSYGAVNEYFRDQSLGKFNPVFDVIGPVTLSKEYAYYGKDNGSVTDIYYNEFVRESLQKACQIRTDWSLLDNNADGKVDMVFLIYAGLGQNYTNSSGDKNTIWPKEQPTSYKIGDTSFAGCSSTCELRPTAQAGGVITATQPDGIGVFCHEFSHALGLPDFYDTKYVAFGMDYWDIMDTGQYAVNGTCPVGYTAYEREFMGWQPLEELTEPRTLRIPCFAKGGHGYKIVNDNNPDEYYILENRQAYGWDMLCRTRGKGLMVTHVDYNRNIWLSNKVNVTPSHQCMTIIPANNSLIGGNTPNVTSQSWTASLRGNLYPGTTENHELTDTSVPASTVYTGGYMHKPLYDIRETADSLIVLKFNPLGTLAGVQNLAPADATDTSLSLTWDAVEDAEAYNVMVVDEFDEPVLQTDSIRTPYCRIQELAPGTAYGFRVQAVSDKYLDSEWSEALRITPSDYADGISDISPESAQLVRVYDINGIFVSECKVSQLGRLGMRSGIYLVKFRNGMVRKTLITP